MKFKKQEIKLYTPDGRPELRVQGYVGGSLACHREQFLNREGDWTITHVESGLRVPQTFKRLKDAKKRNDSTAQQRIQLGF